MFYFQKAILPLLLACGGAIIDPSEARPDFQHSDSHHGWPTIDRSWAQHSDSHLRWLKARNDTIEGSEAKRSDSHLRWFTARKDTIDGSEAQRSGTQLRWLTARKDTIDGSEAQRSGTQLRWLKAPKDSKTPKGNKAPKDSKASKKGKAGKGNPAPILDQITNLNPISIPQDAFDDDCSDEILNVVFGDLTTILRVFEDEVTNKVSFSGGAYKFCYNTRFNLLMGRFYLDDGYDVYVISSGSFCTSGFELLLPGYVGDLPEVFDGGFEVSSNENGDAYEFVFTFGDGDCWKPNSIDPITITLEPFNEPCPQTIVTAASEESDYETYGNTWLGLIESELTNEVAFLGGTYKLCYNSETEELFGRLYLDDGYDMFVKGNGARCESFFYLLLPEYFGDLPLDQDGSFEGLSDSPGDGDLTFLFTLGDGNCWKPDSVSPIVTGHNPFNDICPETIKTAASDYETYGNTWLGLIESELTNEVAFSGGTHKFCYIPTEGDTRNFPKGPIFGRIYLDDGYDVFVYGNGNRCETAFDLLLPGYVGDVPEVADGYFEGLVNYLFGFDLYLFFNLSYGDCWKPSTYGIELTQEPFRLLCPNEIVTAASDFDTYGNTWLSLVEEELSENEVAFPGGKHKMCYIPSINDEPDRPPLGELFGRIYLDSGFDVFLKGDGNGKERSVAGSGFVYLPPGDVGALSNYDGGFGGTLAAGDVLFLTFELFDTFDKFYEFVLDGKVDRIQLPGNAFNAPCPVSIETSVSDGDADSWLTLIEEELSENEVSFSLGTHKLCSSYSTGNLFGRFYLDDGYDLFVLGTGSPSDSASYFDILQPDYFGTAELEGGFFDAFIDSSGNTVISFSYFGP